MWLSSPSPIAASICPSGQPAPRADHSRRFEMKGYVLSVERLIRAAPEVIFDVLSDPGKHSLIDGSGMLQGVAEAEPRRLALGVTFGMGMKLGVSYSTVNTVVEFEENRRISWQTGPKGRMGR